jgi:Fe-S-cluster containining protein
MRANGKTKSGATGKRGGADVTLPCRECGGRCCVNVPLLPTEWRALRQKYGVPPGTLVQRADYGLGKIKATKPDGETCTFLGPDGCAVYEDRPPICRAYGETPDLPCMYLYPDKARAANERLYQLLLRKNDRHQ